MLERIFDAPEEIRDANIQSLTIPRFTRIYKEGIFHDSVGAHTLRCVSKVDRLPIKESDKNHIKNIIWGHDLTEIITTDYTIIQKEADESLANKLESEENKAATTLLPEKYQKYLLDFNNADKFLNNKYFEVLPSPHALVAKTIDNIDGNEYFHKNLTQWISSNLYNSKDLPPTPSLIYAFDSYHKYLNKVITSSKAFAPFAKVVYDLEYFKILKIITYWSSVKKSKIPEVIRDKLSEIK